MSLQRAFPWAALAGALVLPAVLVWLEAADGRPDPATLPVYGVVPAFELTERSGRAVGSDDLGGEPWLASFIFTRCPDVCPAVSGKMTELHRRLPAGVRLLSVSVDPRHDTPAVLRDYARRFEASERWWFVTGGVEEIRSLVGGGFHLSLAENDDGAITHSDRVALVDGSGRIRRYYRGTEPGWVDEALQDLETLAAVR